MSCTTSRQPTPPPRPVHGILGASCSRISSRAARGLLPSPEAVQIPSLTDSRSPQCSGADAWSANRSPLAGATTLCASVRNRGLAHPDRSTIDARCLAFRAHACWRRHSTPPRTDQARAAPPHRARLRDDRLEPGTAPRTSAFPRPIARAFSASTRRRCVNEASRIHARTDPAQNAERTHRRPSASRAARTRASVAMDEAFVGSILNPSARLGLPR